MTEEVTDNDKCCICGNTTRQGKVLFVVHAKNVKSNITVSIQKVGIEQKTTQGQVAKNMKTLQCV